MVDYNILNKTALRDKMKDKPKGQRLHDAFGGDWSLLTIEQIEELREILKEDLNNIVDAFDQILYLRYFK